MLVAPAPATLDEADGSNPDDRLGAQPPTRSKTAAALQNCVDTPFVIRRILSSLRAIAMRHAA
jgi:hypothetical protein